MTGNNLLVVQGGGPSPVLNITLASLIDEAARHARKPFSGPSKLGKVLGARSGILGLVSGDIADLSGLSVQELDLLRTSPGAALGTSRAKSSPEDFERIVENLRRWGVRYLIFMGGNGTMRGAEATGQLCRQSGYEVQVIGAPKTVDNDITGTDRCPGYASAAYYVAQSARDLGMDVRSLPQPVSIFETMGRSAGWLAAASAVAKTNEQDAPHLVYVPERPFAMDAFLSAVDKVVSRLGWAIVVASEGIRDEAGQLVYQTEDRVQADALKRPLTGGVGQHLAETVAKQLKFRCRSEKPGLLGRASMLHASAQDRKDAEFVGRAAVQALLAGETNKMVSLLPLPATDYALVPLSSVAGVERTLPDEWMRDGDIPVTEGFLQYLRPLIGELTQYHSPFTFSKDVSGDFEYAENNRR